jgi:hypothetical protein
MNEACQAQVLSTGSNYSLVSLGHHRGSNNVGSFPYQLLKDNFCRKNYTAYILRSVLEIKFLGF